MLADDLKILLGSTFVEYTKIHGFHFNIEGSNFPQYHEFLNTYYNEVFKTVDIIGEYIRTLGSYTPGGVARMAELSVIKDQLKVPRADLMFVELLQDAETIIELVKAIFNEASQAQEQGIANFMAELQDLYAKKAWFIRSILKKERE